MQIVCASAFSCLSLCYVLHLLACLSPSPPHPPASSAHIFPVSLSLTSAFLLSLFFAPAHAFLQLAEYCLPIPFLFQGSPSLFCVCLCALHAAFTDYVGRETVEFSFSFFFFCGLTCLSLLEGALRCNQFVQL